MVGKSGFPMGLAAIGLVLGATVAATAADNTLDLAPAADTFVEGGTQATWDHGLADHLTVDHSPADVIYLKFDLSAVAAPVTRATLTLSCTDGSSDGGTVYPVADSGWLEGTHKGGTSNSANGPGLKWTDLDTNGDGTLDAADTSPFLPDRSRPLAGIGLVVAGQPITVDVTAAFQAGPGLYSLAIAGGSANKTSYGARESAAAAERPRLHVELAASPAPSTTTTTTTLPSPAPT